MLAQIAEADSELRDYPATGIDRPTRARDAARTIVPWLHGTTPELKRHMERVLNAPALLRIARDRIQVTGQMPAELVAESDTPSSEVRLLLRYVTGEVVSTVVMTHLEAAFPNSDLRPNGKGDYPDLWLRTDNSTQLPAFSRKSKQYGAASKGRPARPVRVPDGLEIKTCRGTIKVGCHFKHAGPHVVVVFASRSGSFTVTDVAVPFLKTTDCREASRSTDATSVIFSFNGDRFISLRKPN